MRFGASAARRGGGAVGRAPSSALRIWVAVPSRSRGRGSGSGAGGALATGAGLAFASARGVHSSPAAGPAGRVAARLPPAPVAERPGNAAESLAAARRAADRGAAVALFPDLSRSGYTCEDLFQSRDVLAAVRKALGDLARDAAALPLTIIV